MCHINVMAESPDITLTYVLIYLNHFWNYYLEEN